MADSSEAQNRSVDQSVEVRLNLTRTELQAMLNTAINNVVDRVLRDHKRKGNDIPIQGCKRGKTGSNYIQSKPKEAKPECKYCGKKRHFSKCIYERIMGCAICKEINHKTHECKELQGKQQSSEKTRCKTCRKYHFGKCRYESQPLPCGICKSKEHKTLDCKRLGDATCHGCGEKGHIKTRCPKKATRGKRTLESRARPCGICSKEGHKTLECQDIKDATCYGCNEIGHIKTNCPNRTKKPGEAKKTKAGNSQKDVQETVQDNNVITGTFFTNNAHDRVLINSGSDKSLEDNRYSKS